MISRMNILLGVLLLLAIAAAVTLYMRGDLDFTHEQRVRVSDERQETQMPVFTWRFEEVDAEDKPQTRVFLSTGEKSREIGIYAGSCAEIAAEQLQEGQVSGVLCWFAGAGDEIGVFKEGDSYVVKVGVQEEPTAESEGFRGDFSTKVHLQ